MLASIKRVLRVSLVSAAIILMIAAGIAVYFENRVQVPPVDPTRVANEIRRIGDARLQAFGIDFRRLTPEMRERLRQIKKTRPTHEFRYAPGPIDNTEPVRDQQYRELHEPFYKLPLRD